MAAMTATASLTACGSASGDQDERAPAAPVDIDPVGQYETIMADGVVVIQTINADGTYRNESNGELLEEGSWVIKQGKLCFDPEGVEAESCFDGGNPAGGDRYMKRDESGEVELSVRKMPEAEAAPETPIDAGESPTQSAQ